MFSSPRAKSRAALIGILGCSSVVILYSSIYLPFYSNYGVGGDKNAATTNQIEHHRESSQSHNMWKSNSGKWMMNSCIQVLCLWHHVFVIICTFRIMHYNVTSPMNETSTVYKYSRINKKVYYKELWAHIIIITNNCLAFHPVQAG